MDGAIKKHGTYESDGVTYCERLGMRCWMAGKLGVSHCEWCDSYHEPCGFRPYEQRILVMLDKRRDTYGSLVIPDHGYARRQPQVGTCVAVGRCLNADGSYTGLEIKIGQRPIFGKYNGVELAAPDGFDPKREFYLLRVDPDLRFEGDSRVHMDEVLGLAENELSAEERRNIVPD
jgi:co-chaperonin GroES (HSP10)